MKKIFKSIQNFFIKLFGGFPEEVVEELQRAGRQSVFELEQEQNRTMYLENVNKELERKLYEYEKVAPKVYTYRVEPEVIELRAIIGFQRTYPEEKLKEVVEDTLRRQLELYSDRIIKRFPITEHYDIESDMTTYYCRFGVVPVIKEEYEEYEKNKKKCF